MAPRKQKKRNTDSRSASSWKDRLDTGAKYLGAVAGLLAIYVAHSFQATLSTTNLINQREEAESKLRATMFSNLIQPLIINDKKEGLSPQSEKLLSELLALNFHENFEFKPLLTHLDERLQAERPNDKEYQQARRNALRSIARRVIQRQNALVTRLDTNGNAGAGIDPESSCVTRIVILRVEKMINPDKVRSVPAGQKLGCYGMVIVRERFRDKNNELRDELVKIQAPDRQTYLELVVGSVDWENQTVDLDVSIRAEPSWLFRPPQQQHVSLFNADFFKQHPKKSMQAALYESTYFQENLQGLTDYGKVNADIDKVDKKFTLTWFDFPLTDYTLLSNGTRFSFFVDSFDDGEYAVIKLLWFPRDFFSPRERPTSYRAYREKPWE